MTIESLAFISGNAASLIRFKGALVARLARRGIRIIALAPDHDDRSRAQLRALGAEPVDYSLDRTGRSPLRDFSDLVRLVLTLRRLRPQAVFGWFLKPAIYGSVAATLAGVPVRIASIEGLGYYFTSGERQRLAVRLIRLLIASLLRVTTRLCDRMYFFNADDRACVFGHRPSTGKVALVAGVGVDLLEYRPAPLPEGPITFVMVARLLREKGVLEFAEAARIVRANRPEARFLLVGGTDSNPGAIAPSLAARWHDMGLLEWLGQVEDVRPYLERASVFVLPSWREGASRSIQEALAMGRPVITTTAPGCRQSIEDGRQGYLVPVRDQHALAAAMVRFVDQPWLITDMGAAARRRAEQLYDVHRLNLALEDDILAVGRTAPLSQAWAT